MTYTVFIEALNHYLWLFDFILLIGVAWHAKHTKNFSSSLVTLIVTLVIGGVMTAYTPELKAFIRANKPPDGDHSMYQLGLAVWYMGFVVFNMLAIVVTWKIHLWYRIQYSYITYVHFLAYFLLSVLQIMRHVERLTVDQDWLKVFYQMTVLSINTAVTLTSLVIFVGVVVSQHRIKQGKKGLSWSL